MIGFGEISNTPHLPTSPSPPLVLIIDPFRGSIATVGVWSPNPSSNRIWKPNSYDKISQLNLGVHIFVLYSGDSQPSKHPKSICQLLIFWLTLNLVYAQISNSSKAFFPKNLNLLLQ